MHHGRGDAGGHFSLHASNVSEHHISRALKAFTIDDGDFHLNGRAEKEIQDMAQKGWDPHPLGDTAVFPVTGVKTGTALKGKAGVMRVEYGTEPTLQKRKAQQFLLTAQQVRSLSETLAALADRLEAAGSDDTPTDPVN